MGVMIFLFLTTTITCSDALSVINRIAKVVGLTEVQKQEITTEIRKTIQFCPITVEKDVK